MHILYGKKREKIKVGEKEGFFGKKEIWKHVEFHTVKPAYLGTEKYRKIYKPLSWALVHVLPKVVNEAFDIDKVHGTIIEGGILTGHDTPMVLPHDPPAVLDKHLIPILEPKDGVYDPQDALEYITWISLAQGALAAKHFVKEKKKMIDFMTRGGESDILNEYRISERSAEAWAKALYEIRTKDDPDMLVGGHGLTIRDIKQLGMPFWIPGPKEIYYNRERLETLAEALSRYKKEFLGVDVPKEEIIKVLKDTYPLARELIREIEEKDLHVLYSSLKTDELNKILSQLNTFQKYMKYLEEYAGLKRKVEHPTPTKTIVRTPTHEVGMEVPEKEARTAVRARELLTDILTRVRPVDGKVGIPLKELELTLKELEIERHVGEKAFELLGTLERDSLVEGILDEEIVRIGREIREVRGKDVLNEAIEDVNQKIRELDSKVAKLVIAKRISLLNLLISILSEVLRNPQRYGILSKEGKLYVDYQMFITEVYPRLERALREK